MILSDVRFIREALAEILGRDQALSIVGVSADIGEAGAICQEREVSIVLLDTALPDGLASVGRIREFAPEARVVALGLAETDANVIAWAEAGAAGYVPRGAGLAELVGALRGVMRGEQACPAGVAAGLLRRLAERTKPADGEPPSADSLRLTRREAEIVGLLGDGLSNKDIARRLHIAVATAKSHVHNLLRKLSVTRRGQVGTRVPHHGAGIAGSP